MVYEHRLKKNALSKGQVLMICASCDTAQGEGGAVIAALLWVGALPVACLGLGCVLRAPLDLDL